MASPISISKSKLLLVEGMDAYRFFISAYQAFGVADIQVMNFGGNEELPNFLRQLKLLEGFERVSSIAIVRDAEENAQGAVASVKTALVRAGLPCPDNPFQFSGEGLRVSFMILPGHYPDTNELMSGTLEDLCLEMVNGDPIFECVDQYINCIAAKGGVVRRLHKARLHAYLAGKGDFAGLKIGEAADRGAWDWEHERLELYRQIIREM